MTFINGNISNEQAKSIANRAMSSKENLEALSKEIMADGRVDENEAKVITMVGFYTDEANKQDVKSHFTQPNDSVISDLFEKGFELGDKAVKSYKSHSGTKAWLRDIGSAMTGGLINSASKEVKENNQGVMRNLNATLDSLRTSCERTDCVRVTLKRITGIDIGTDQAQEVTETYLNKVTGVKDKDKNGWDAINASKYNKDGKNGDLQKLLAPYQATNGEKTNGKALIVVGAHTYQFVGFNKDGHMIVKDPSDNNRSKVIGKDNPSVTVYVQRVDGKGGDGGVTGRISPDSTAKGFNEFKRAGVSLSSDRMDNSGESKQVRKLLVLMGDKDQNNKALFDAIKSGKVSEVQKILKSKDINISDQEIKAFISVMNTKLSNGSTMIKEFEKMLSDNSDGAFSRRCKYLNGIEYSDISLKDYFTKTKPEAVFDIFKDMCHGRDGC